MEKRRAERYKKQLQRRKGVRNASDENEIEYNELLTPKSKTLRMLSSRGANQRVKKTLIFHNSLVAEIKAKIKCNREHKLLKQLISGKIISKYRLRNMLSKAVGLSRTAKEKKENKKTVKVALVEQVRKFLERDENSK